MIWLHVALPLSAPAIGTLTIMVFFNVWDEFLYALTLIKSPEKRTLFVALKMFQGQNLTNRGLIFAASLIALTPILLIYIILQKQLIRGGISDGLHRRIARREMLIFAFGCMFLPALKRMQVRNLLTVKDQRIADYERHKHGTNAKNLANISFYALENQSFARTQGIANHV